MKRSHLASLAAAATLVGVGAFALHAKGQSDNKKGASLYVTDVVPGYRDWRLVSVAREEGTLDDIRAVLGNDAAVKAYRQGKPFPDGAIIARIAWSYDASEENNATFHAKQSFVAGAPKNGVQFMVKDSKKYAATGGWGYGHFDGGVSADDRRLAMCLPCHQAVAGRDFVFTKYAP